MPGMRFLNTYGCFALHHMFFIPPPCLFHGLVLFKLANHACDGVITMVVYRDRAREECLRVLGETGPADFENIKELETLENSLKETLRLRSVPRMYMRIELLCRGTFAW